MQYELTFKQKEILEKLKDKVEDIAQPEWTDHFLTKWLVARDFDLTKAEEMIRNSMAYRQKMHVDTLLDQYTPPEVIRQYLVGGMCGHDKDGSPVRVEPFGNLDMRGLLRSVRKSDLERMSLRNCEELVRECHKQSEKLGREVDGFTLIFDMTNFSMKMLWMQGLQVYMQSAQILQNNYPEMQKRMLVINAPKIFPVLWKIGQHLLSDEAKKKISILGKNYKDELLKYVAEEELPAYLGGLLRDENDDPMCKTKICHGGEVPSKYFLSESTELNTMRKQVIPAGQKMKLQFDVRRTGTILCWGFRTEEGDINFGINFSLSGKKGQPLVPVKRVESNILEQDGSLTCTKIGVYTVQFDNSFSWTRQKTLHFDVDVFDDEPSVSKDLDMLAQDSSWARYISGVDEKTQL